MNYNERLGRLKLYYLECGNQGVDLIDTYKIMRGTDKINAYNLFHRVGES